MKNPITLDVKITSNRNGGSLEFTASTTQALLHHAMLLYKLEHGSQALLRCIGNNYEKFTQNEVNKA